MPSTPHDQSQIKWISDFIWGIADDRLRDVYVRGKYRDVILPMTVLRRLDAVLEPTKGKVLEHKAQLDARGITSPSQQGPVLCQAAGQAFWNRSPFTMRALAASGQGQRLQADFEAWLDGFSPNVQEILGKFEFHRQIAKLTDAGILGSLIADFLNPKINLAPHPVPAPDGRGQLPALDNHGMGTVFEELIRRFSEDNNEEAGEHFTPRDVVRLMAQLLFLPVASRIQSTTYTLYDGSCGTGGMLTVAEDALHELAASSGKSVTIDLFGQEINEETWAICKADMLLKGATNAEHIVGGADCSTLSADAFPHWRFDFMLSNPPYGKSWKTDQERLGGKGGINDPRFIIQHGGNADYPLITRSNDGQLMFLVNKLAKMRADTPLGSRIAMVHNGSALFTGDAGSGESNIRRWILENDWLEAIIALPLNMFYNTDIATYIWVLANKKSENRRGKVQLIDATGWSQPLRRNLGKKNCELGADDIARILALYMDEAQTPTAQSKWFAPQDFGYWKITVERPLRLKSQLADERIESLRFASGDEALRAEIYATHGEALYTEFAKRKPVIEAWLKGEGENEGDDNEDSDSCDDFDAPAARKAVPAKRRKKLLDASTWQRDKRLVEVAQRAQQVLGRAVFDDHNGFRARFEAALKAQGDKLGAPEKKAIYKAVSWRDETAPPVIARRTRLKKDEHFEPGNDGAYLLEEGGQRTMIEYEPDSSLRDNEQIPLNEPGGIDAFFAREVLPYAPDAWIATDKTQIGYEISFARYFYQPTPLRSLEEIRADILALAKESEGLLRAIVGEGE